MMAGCLYAFSLLFSFFFFFLLVGWLDGDGEVGKWWDGIARERKETPETFSFFLFFVFFFFFYRNFDMI